MARTLSKQEKILLDRSKEKRVRDTQEQWGFAQERHHRWAMMLPIDTPFSECLRESYYAEVCHHMQPTPGTRDKPKTGGIIEVRSEDNSFYAELYILAVREKGLKVCVLREPVMLQEKMPGHENYEANWNRAFDGYDIVRKSDRETVAHASNLKTRQDVAGWLSAAP